MRILAIDTSSIACSAALCVGSKVIERYEQQAQEHTRLLMPMIRSVLAEGDTGIGELDAIVLGNGPGSFIGMRIAASVAQGLAHGAHLTIVPVSSLAAIAAQVFADTEAGEVVVAQDAHMNEVYLGIYERDDSGLPEPLVPERLHGQTLIAELEDNPANGRVAAGYGWQRYALLLSANEPFIESFSDILYPRARYLLGLGAEGLQNGAGIDPGDIMPAYLRNKVAAEPSRGLS